MITIHVAQRHVRSIPLGGTVAASCPIANALFEATRRAWIVTPTEAIPLRGTPSQAVPLPDNARAAIVHYDETGDMPSFAFMFAWERASRRVTDGERMDIMRLAYLRFWDLQVKLAGEAKELVTA